MSPAILASLLQVAMVEAVMGIALIATSLWWAMYQRLDTIKSIEEES